MAYDKELADRIRFALSADAPVREVKMFGGLTFMVDERLTATADSHGQLMVRCDPDRVEELLERDGAHWPEMHGRKMSRGWIVVDASGTKSDKDFRYWIEEALTYNRKSNGSGN